MDVHIVVQHEENGKDNKINEQDNEYVVKNIVDKKIEVTNGVEQVYYKIQWKEDEDGTRWEDTWEPLEALKNCPYKIKSYETKVAKKSRQKVEAKFWQHEKMISSDSLNNSATNKFWEETDDNGLITPLTEGSMLETIKRRRSTQPFFEAFFEESDPSESDIESSCSEKPQKGRGRKKRKSVYTRGRKKPKSERHLTNSLESKTSDKNCSKISPNSTCFLNDYSKLSVENNDNEDSDSKLRLYKINECIKDITEGLNKLSMYLKNTNPNHTNNNNLNVIDPTTPSTNGALSDLGQLDDVEGFSVLSDFTDCNVSGINFDDESSLSSLLEIGVPSSSVNTTFSNNFDIRRQTAFNHLQNMLAMCNNQLHFMNAPKVYSITYVMTKEIESALKQALHAAVVAKDCETLHNLFLRYRPCELSLNELYDDKTIIMMLSSTDCTVTHEPCRLIEFLVMSGANIDERNSSRSTALIEAVKLGKFCSAKKLIELGFAIDAVDVNEENALFAAICYCPSTNISDIISLLVSSGVSINRCNIYGHSITYVAQTLQKLCYCQIINNHVERFQHAFADHMTKIVPEHWQVGAKVIDFQYFEVTTELEWNVSFNVSELYLPQGTAGFLFMALMNFNEQGIEFKFGNNIPVLDVYFNGRVLQSYFYGSMDILCLSHLVQGLNKLVLKMKHVKPKGNVKVALQANLCCMC